MSAELAGTPKTMDELVRKQFERGRDSIRAEVPRALERLAGQLNAKGLLNGGAHIEQAYAIHAEALKNSLDALLRAYQTLTPGAKVPSETDVHAIAQQIDGVLTEEAARLQLAVDQLLQRLSSPESPHLEMKARVERLRIDSLDQAKRDLDIWRLQAARAQSMPSADASPTERRAPDVILSEIARTQPEIQQYRIEHEDERGVLNDLDAAHLIQGDEGHYKPTLNGIVRLQDTGDVLAAQLLSDIAVVFEDMRAAFKANHKAPWTSQKAESRLSLSSERLHAAIGPLKNSPVSCWQTYGHNADGHTFTLTESILDFKRFDEYLRAVKKTWAGGLPALGENPFVAPPVERPKPPPPKWTLLRSLGEGGQGWTELVRDSKGNQCVRKRLKNIARRDRFEREVMAVRDLDHKNIIKIIEADLSNERPYYIMEYCRGGDLGKAPSQLTPHMVFPLFQQICSAVSAAHEKQIVHRDIKPANILLRQDSVPVLSDFGICFLAGGDRLTSTSEAVGPRHFMAPELEDGRHENPDPRCDIYSLGKLLYWMLSGGKSFPREKHRDPPYDLKERLGDASEHVNNLLDRMICYDPAVRIGSVAAMQSEVAEVERLIAGQFNLPGKGDQRCRYCGRGRYRIQAENATDVRNFGFVLVGGSKWRILVCDECGNVQAFREDILARLRQRN